jgi:hypothetical protein
MTQVQTMTNPELNRALAELMGYTVEPSVQSGVYRLMKGGKIQATSSVPEELIWSYAPDYAGDPAASLEVQTKAIEQDPAGYIDNLQLVKTGQTMDVGYWTHPDIAMLLTASPRERAEAAYITLQEAKENG